MSDRIQKGSLAIDQQLYNFIQNEVLPEVGVDSEQYWQNFEKSSKNFNHATKPYWQNVMKSKQKIDNWHKENPAKNGTFDKAKYTQFFKRHRLYRA